MARMLAVAALAALCAVPVEGTVKTLSLMTWNVMQFPTTAGVFDWDQVPRADRIEAAILALDPQPDIIGFQEVLNSQTTTAIGKLRSRYPYQTEVLGSSCSGLSGIFQKIDGNCPKVDYTQLVSSGIILISKHPFVYTNALFFDTHAAYTADSFAVKGAIYLKVAIDSKFPVHIVVTHLQSDSPLFGDLNTNNTHTIRMEQMREINAYLNNFAIPATEPVIIMGDLNVLSSETARYNDLLDAAQATSSLSDPDGFGTVSCENNWVSNWFTAKYNAGKACSKGYVLDYILVRTANLQPTTPTSGRVVQMKFPTKIKWGGSNPLTRDNGMYNDLADHYALYQSFSFDLQEQKFTLLGGASRGAASLLATAACVVALLATFVL